jgi:hypothetical protein
MPNWKTQYNRLRVRSATSSDRNSRKRYDSAARDIAKGEMPKVRIHSKDHVQDEKTRRQMEESLLRRRKRIQHRKAPKGKIPGGKSEGKTIADIARKHGMPITKVESAIRRGVRIEKEHTTDPAIAREIAKDHIYENPRYYEVLARIENIRPGRKKTKQSPSRSDKDEVNEDAPTNNVGSGNIAGTSPGEQPPIRSRRIKRMFRR